MKLFIQFAEQDKLGEIIDLVRAAVTILPTNPASVPVDESNGQYYFALDVTISLEQLQQALANGVTDLGSKAEEILGWDETKFLGLFFDNDDQMYKTWYLDVKFADRKLIATPVGIPIGLFSAR